MAGLRAQLSWMIRGQAHTAVALQTLSVDLRELQAKVASLDAALADIGRGQAALGARQLDEFDKVRVAVAVATDDLTARVNAVHEQLRGRT